MLYKKDRFLENTIVNSTSSTGDYEGLYVADFETSKVNEIDNDVFVYATGLMDVFDKDSRCLHTDNIKDFVNDKNYSRLMNTIVEHYRLGWEKNNVNINNLRILISNGNENIDILVENTKKVNY